MEALVTPQNRDAVLRGIKALLSPIQEHWADTEAYGKAALEVLGRSGAQALSDPRHAAALAGQVYALVVRFRGLNFRPLDNLQALDTVYQKLAPNVAGNPVRDGSLWLAYRLHQSAINFLQAPEGRAALPKIYTALENRREEIGKALEEMEKPTLDGIEFYLVGVIRDAVGPGVGLFQLGALAGFVLERTREAARQMPNLDLLPPEHLGHSADARVVHFYTEWVRKAELEDARGRFSRLSEQARSTRYDVVRRELIRHIRELAPFAPAGFEKFCEAVEAKLFPYPAPMEWVRSFLRPIYSNASQSATFDNCMSVASVHQRYAKLKEEKSANIVMLELGRAFALAAFKAVQAESLRNFMKEIDLHAEFNWPTSLDELKPAVAPRRSGP